MYMPILYSRWHDGENEQIAAVRKNNGVMRVGSSGFVWDLFCHFCSLTEYAFLVFSNSGIILTAYLGME